jgi:non-heme chloroperoxidase
MTIERRTTRSGPSIRYLDNAPAAPEGLPILFAPGLSDFADEYTALLEDLSPRRVLVVEVRGRGGSDEPDTGYASGDHADDLAAVLDEEHIDRFHLMTFSRGTTWGLDLVSRMPERIVTLAVGDYLPQEVGLPPDFAGRQIESRFRGRPMRERISLHVLDELAAASRTRPLDDVVAGFRAPLLVAQPLVEQRVLDDEGVERWRRARPDVEVVAMPDAEHDIFRPDRLRYGRAVVEHLRRRCPGT